MEGDGFEQPELPASSAGAPGSAWARRFAVLAVVLLGTALRLVWLDSVPPAINQDEAINAYDAWCVRATGQDHTGQRWPIFFRAFGDYHPGSPIYLQMPFQAVLGMNPWSARLPDALMGILNVWLVYLLARRFLGFEVGLWSALFLAISPWHIHISRLAFGLSISLTLVTLGLLWIASAAQSLQLDTPSWRRRLGFAQLVGAGLALGLALWTYHAMRVTIPLLLAGGAALYWRRVVEAMRTSRGRYGLLVFLLSFGLGAAPFIWASIATPGGAWARATGVLLFNKQGGLGAAALTTLSNYAVHFSPSFLFIRGDHSFVQHLRGYGQLHWFYALLLPIGLVRIFWQRSREPFGLFLLWWMLIGPVPAALTALDCGHALRSAGVIPAYEMVAALGLTLLWRAARRYSLSTYYGAVGTVGLVIAAHVFYFAYLFFVTYPQAAHAHLHAPWRSIVPELQKRESAYDAVVLPPLGMPWIHYVFWSRISPAAFRAMPKAYLTTPDYEEIIRLGKVHFLPTQALPRFLQVLPGGSRVLVGLWSNAKNPGEVGRLRLPGLPDFVFLELTRPQQPR